MRRGGRELGALLLVAQLLLPAAPSFAGKAMFAPKPKGPAKKIELMHKRAAELNAIAVKQAFTFEAPPGFVVAAGTSEETSAKDSPSFSATLESAHAEMHAWIDKGATPITELALTEQALQRIERWKVDHPTGTAKLLKKELVKLDGGPSLRLLFELRADVVKSAKATRELIYILTSATHNARVVYTAPAASYGKLEKQFDASLRQTRGIEAAPTSAGAAAPAKAVTITPAEATAPSTGTATH